MTATTGPPAAERYLATLFGDAPESSLIEIRFRSGGHMARSFFAHDNVRAAARRIVALQSATDVYVGVLPRHRRGGGRDDVVDRGAVVWVDCDTHGSTEALALFTPRPSMIVASGTGHHRHAYWLLCETLPVEKIERINRGLASILRADPSCGDAARILRPPSLNHKRVPPAPVRLLRCIEVRHPAEQLIAVAGIAASGEETPRRPGPRASTDDPLLELPPSLYVEVLTGLTVPRHRKVRCPFHADDTPSLHVYDEPSRGWYCYGCRRGGSVYDLAALLWKLETRGRQFVALRDRLDELLSPIA